MFRVTIIIAILLLYFIVCNRDIGAFKKWRTNIFTGIPTSQKDSSVSGNGIFCLQIYEKWRGRAPFPPNSNVHGSQDSLNTVPGRTALNQLCHLEKSSTSLIDK